MPERYDQIIHHSFGMFGARGEAEPFSAGGDGGVVDWGCIHAEFADQSHRHGGSARGVADHQGDDMAFAVQAG